MTVLSSIKSTIKNLLSPKAVVLMYHQVCDRQSDPWQLAVSPENFEQQLDWLKRNFRVVSLSEMVEALRTKRLHHKMLAITFDDATIDNYFTARPRLRTAHVPATFFSTTYAAENDHSFWWEELESIILHTDTLPNELMINIGEKVFSFEMKFDAVITESLRNEIKLWNADMQPSNERLQLFMLLWRNIQPLPFAVQNSVISELRDWAELAHTKGACYAMSADQLYDMSRDPLFTIGAHTVHHAMLGAQPAEEQGIEIRDCRSTLEQWTSKPVTGFAYPYGNYNETTKTLLQDAGFEYAVSTENNLVTAADDLFELPRIQVKNWNGAELEAHLLKMLVS